MSWLLDINHSNAPPKRLDAKIIPTYYLDETIGQWREIKTNIIKKPECTLHKVDSCPVWLCRSKKSNANKGQEGKK